MGKHVKPPTQAEIADVLRRVREMRELIQRDLNDAADLLERVVPQGTSADVSEQMVARFRSLVEERMSKAPTEREMFRVILSRPNEVLDQETIAQKVCSAIPSAVTSSRTVASMLRNARLVDWKNDILEQMGYNRFVRR